MGSLKGSPDTAAWGELHCAVPVLSNKQLGDFDPGPQTGSQVSDQIPFLTRSWSPGPRYFCIYLLLGFVRPYKRNSKVK